jgi:sporulation protein YlmC with PRC-barrel domain
VYNENMLQLSGSLLSKPVLSLRSGGPVARIVSPIFNPNNLKIEGFYCDDTIDKKRLVLLYQDIREFSQQGFIIDDHDVLAQPHELVRLKRLINLNFELLKKPVETTSKEKIGKVSDYAVETTTMYVQKLYVSRSIIRNLTGGGLSIDRSQIVEITNSRVIINDLLQGNPSPVTASIA